VLFAAVVHLFRVLLFGREISVLSDSRIVNWESGGCDFASNKPNARSMLKANKTWNQCLLSWLWAA